MAHTTSDMRVSGTVENVFDGELGTIGMINGAQEAGKHITFDLGQVIHFSSLRYYIIETQLNYLRNADFEISVDGDEWTPVLHVGQATENVWDDTTAKDMQGITLTHDDMNPGYMYAEATGLDADGRYIRVTPAETYSHRWVGFSEIQINGAASVRLIQLGVVSNAEVSANYIGEENAESLGRLDQAIGEFIIPPGKTLESFWGGRQMTHGLRTVKRHIRQHGKLQTKFTTIKTPARRS